MFHDLRPLDRLVLIYLMLTGLMALAGAGIGAVYLKLAGMHLLAVAGILGLVQVHRRWPRIGIVRWCYPLLLIPFIHYEIELLGQLIYRGRFFDEVVAGWDAWMFGSNPHLWLQYVLAGPIWSEVMHFFYVTFYPILIGGILYTWFRRRDRIGEFAFVFIGMFCSFMIMFILFPVIGPLDERALYFEEVGVLATIVDFIFEGGDSDGGAFPSSHVGQSIGVLLLLRPMRWYVMAGLVITIAGLSVATTYTMIHYAIDAVAGVPAGIALYYVWSAVYRRVDRGRGKEAAVVDSSVPGGRAVESR